MDLDVRGIICVVVGDISMDLDITGTSVVVLVGRIGAVVVAVGRIGGVVAAGTIGTVVNVAGTIDGSILNSNRL